MVEDLEVETLDAENISQNFDAKSLSDFVEGRLTLMSDDCDDIEYEYMVDFSRGCLHAHAVCREFGSCIVTFDMIEQGVLVSNFDQYIYDN